MVSLDIDGIVYEDPIDAFERGCVSVLAWGIIEDIKQKTNTASADDFCVAINSNSVERATADVVRTALEGVSGEVFAVGFGEKELPELIEVLRSMDSGPTVRLLGCVESL